MSLHSHRVRQYQWCSFLLFMASDKIMEWFLYRTFIEIYIHGKQCENIHWIQMLLLDSSLPDFHLPSLPRKSGTTSFPFNMSTLKSKPKKEQRNQIMKNHKKCYCCWRWNEIFYCRSRLILLLSEWINFNCSVQLSHL